MAGGTQGGGIKRSGSRGTVPGARRRSARSAPSAVAPPSLDGLSLDARGRLVYGHWHGGFPFSDFAGAWGLEQRTDTDAQQEYDALAEAVAFAPGTTRVLAETRDVSGAGRNLTMTSEDDAGELVSAADAPTLEASGYLAARMPAQPIGVWQYTRADTLGLPADTSAFTIFHQRYSADPSDAQYPVIFCDGFGPTDDWLFWVYSLSGLYALSCYPAAGEVANVSFDDAAIADARWMSIHKAAGATAANVVVKAEGVQLTSRTVNVAGTFTLAGADRFGYLANSLVESIESALLVFEGDLSAEDQAVCNAFFEAVCAEQAAAQSFDPIAAPPNYHRYAIPFPADGLPPLGVIDDATDELFVDDATDELWLDGVV